MIENCTIFRLVKDGVSMRGANLVFSLLVELRLLLYLRSWTCVENFFETISR